jgi:hypothetical protein
MYLCISVGSHQYHSTAIDADVCITSLTYNGLFSGCDGHVGNKLGSHLSNYLFKYLSFE